MPRFEHALSVIETKASSTSMLFRCMEIYGDRVSATIFKQRHSRISICPAERQGMSRWPCQRVVTSSWYGPCEI